MVKKTICLQCGNRGFENAFVYCIRCLKFAVHRYCLDEMPETLDEFVCWLCDDCEVKVRKQSTVFEHDAIPSQAREHNVLKSIKSFSRNGMEESGLVIVEKEHDCKDPSEQAYDGCANIDSVDRGELASQRYPVESDGQNYENPILLPVDVSAISQQNQQLEEEKVDGNLIGSIELSAGCLTGSTTEKDQLRIATTSYDEEVKADIGECTKMTSNSTIPSIVKENGCPEQKEEEKKKIVNKKKSKRKRKIVGSITEEDQNRLATTSFDECLKVIKECTRLASDLTLHSNVKENGCSEQKDQEEKKIENKKRRREKNIKKCTGSASDSTLPSKMKENGCSNQKAQEEKKIEIKEKRRTESVAASHEEHVEVDISECTRLESDSALPSTVKENGCSEQKDQEEKKIENKKKRRKRKRNIMGSTTEKDQHRLASTSHDKHVKADISGCTRSGSDSTLPSNVKENEGSEQKDQMCIIKPFVTITDLGVTGARAADHPVISSDGPSKILRKEKTITSSETISQKQVYQTGVADVITREKDLGSISDCVENREPEDKEDQQTSTSYLKNLDHSVAQPIATPIWRGSFSIPDSKYGNIDELIAHISNKACHKVYEAASQFQPLLRLEMLPKSDIWPKSFQTSEPNGDNIALYFFPSKIRNQVFEQLVEEMIDKDLAFKGVLQNAELLIFTSTELPLRYRRFQNKYYLWGVFRGKKAAPTNPIIRVGEVTEIPSMRKRCDDRSPIRPLSNAATGGLGMS